MDIFLLSVGGMVVLAGALAWSTYNRLMALDERCNTAFADVDVLLKHRHNLIPNLVETVRGYAGHERSTFEAVTEARASAVQAGGVAQQAEAENALTSALRQLFAVAEAYPQLRASENFQQLQSDLSDTEDKIAVARQLYNDAVLTYQSATQTVPTNLLAGTFGFGPRQYFEIEERTREAPRVDFSPAESAPSA